MYEAPLNIIEINVFYSTFTDIFLFLSRICCVVNVFNEYF